MSKRTGIQHKLIAKAVADEFPNVTPTLRTWEHGVPEKLQYEVVAQAKVRFMEGAKFPEIHLELGLPLGVYQTHEARWMTERDAMDVSIVEKIREDKIGEKAKEFIDLGFSVALRTLKHLDENETVLDAKNLKLLSDAVFGMNKIRRLENDQPTEIKKFDGLSQKELEKACYDIVKENKAFLELTPFSDAIDVTPDA